jgi:hypothetical protein
VRAFFDLWVKADMGKNFQSLSLKLRRIWKKIRAQPNRELLGHSNFPLVFFTTTYKGLQDSPNLLSSYHQRKFVVMNYVQVSLTSLSLN